MALLRVLTTEQRCSNTPNHGDSDPTDRRNLPCRAFLDKVQSFILNSSSAVLPTIFCAFSTLVALNTASIELRV
jgi:hypothetical protein